MFARATVIAALLAVPLAKADDRYPPPRMTGQPAAEAANGGGAPPAANSGANPSTPPAGRGGGSNRSLFDNAATPSASGATNNGNAPSGGSTNPFRGSPSGTVAAPRSLSPNGGVRPIAGANDPQTGRAAYEVSPPANGVLDAQPGGGLKPSAMMRAMLSPPSGSQLRGQPVSLQDVIASARTRTEQTQHVDAYWDMCSSVADYYLGLREQEELRKLRTYVQQVGPTWQQAETELSVRVGTSQRAALASQLRVASLIGRGANNLPLPADTPHCASYITHYEQIFPRGEPSEARELAALLPLRYAELKDAAAAVTRAEGWLDTVAAARNDNSDGTGSLRALELLALRRRAFVQIARDYNRRIARYSELASPGQISANRLTGMLINSSTSTTATKPGSSAPPGNRRSSGESSPPRTFVKGSPPVASPASKTSTRDDAVRPASTVQPASTTPSSPRDERSVLVPAHG
jgi:hypothetical protein